MPRRERPLLAGNLHTAILKILQLSRCNFKNQSEIIKDTKHWQQFSIFFSYFTHFLDYTHEIPATTSSTQLQYSNEPQLMLSIILPNLSVINHNIGVLGRDHNFIFLLFNSVVVTGLLKRSSETKLNTIHCSLIKISWGDSIKLT